MNLKVVFSSFYGSKLNYVGTMYAKFSTMVMMFISVCGAFLKSSEALNIYLQNIGNIYK